MTASPLNVTVMKLKHHLSQTRIALASLVIRLNCGVSGTESDGDVLKTIEFEAGMSNSRILSSEESKRAKEVIFDLESKLRVLDERLCPDDSRRAKIAARLARFRVAVAPIKRLPPEVLYYIFSFLTPTAYPWEWMPPARWEIPWPLRVVSYTWRTVALNIPTLWKNTNFTINRKATYRLGYDYKLLSREGTLTTLVMMHMVLDVSTMESIGRGTLFPRLVSLECAVSSPTAFLDMVKGRLGLESQYKNVVSTLLRAWGVHTNTSHHWGDPLAEKGWNAAEGLWKLGQATGRDFWLGMESDPCGSCHYTVCRRRGGPCAHAERNVF